VTIVELAALIMRQERKPWSIALEEAAARKEAREAQKEQERRSKGGRG
jgi:hypothetical protein